MRCHAAQFALLRLAIWHRDLQQGFRHLGSHFDGQFHFRGKGYLLIRRLRLHNGDLDRRRPRKVGKRDGSAKQKTRQVQALNESITISNDLFRSARADYMEVLLTQRDALESRFELVETKMQQYETMVNLYRSLGGGWKQ